MDKKINLSQLTDLFIKAGGLNKNLSEQFVRSFFEIISENVLKGETVKIKGFGTFKMMQMDSRESINVNTGERIVIEGHKKISFSPEATLKDTINKPFSAFETVELNDQQVDALENDVLENKSKIEVLTETHNDDEASEKIISTKKNLVESKKKEQPKVLKSKKVQHEDKKNSKKYIGLRIALYSASSLLVILLAVYILWPLNLLRFLRFSDISQDEKQMVSSVNVDKIGNNSLDTFSDSIFDDTIDIEENVIDIEEGQKEDIDESLISNKATAEIKHFTMIASDENKDLSLFNISDTVNYKMKGTKAEHILQSGETLTMIALKYYGTKKLWPYIAAYNNVKNFNTLIPGSKILVPVLENK